MTRPAVQGMAWVFVAALAGALLPPGAARADGFSTGGVFLPLGHGARAHGLGGAGRALLRDDTATYWNPANLAWSARRQITLMHAALVPQIDDGYDTASWGGPWGRRLGEESQPLRPTRGGIGIFFSHLGLGFDTSDWSEARLQVGGAYALGNYATIGVAAKFLRLRNDFDQGNASGLGFDVAASVLVTPRFFASAVVRDLWTSVRFDTDTRQEQAPALEGALAARLGTAWNVAADLVFREGALRRTALGVEWSGWRGLFALRGGWSLWRGGETRSFPSAGAALYYDRFALDYGAAFDDDDAFGIGHRISLQVGL